MRPVPLTHMHKNHASVTIHHFYASISTPYAWLNPFIPVTLCSFPTPCITSKIHPKPSAIPLIAHFIPTSITTTLSLHHIIYSPPPFLSLNHTIYPSLLKCPLHPFHPTIAWLHHIHSALMLVSCPHDSIPIHAHCQAHHLPFIILPPNHFLSLSVTLITTCTFQTHYPIQWYSNGHAWCSGYELGRHWPVFHVHVWTWHIWFDWGDISVGRVY